MNWVEFRDNVVQSVKFDTVTESMKEEFAKWLLEVVLPVAKTASVDFITQIKAQANTETGWCKIRDYLVLPFAIEGGLWAVDYVLKKTIQDG